MSGNITKGSPKKGSFWSSFREPRTQASLFNYIPQEPERSVWADFDWSFLRHPIRTLREEWKAPRARPSLFHHLEDDNLPKEPFRLKEFLLDLITSFRNPLFIPSIFSDPQNLLLDRAELRTRRMEAGMGSIFVHFAIIGLAIFLVFHKIEPIAPKDSTVFINTSPIYMPFEGDGRDGGGGGGGGKQEKLPASGGRMPETTRVQMIAPDPSDPQPLVPVEDLMAATPSVQMPIDIPQDQSMSIGDVTAPPREYSSSGPGFGGGIGTGRGTGVGPGSGPGVGPGSGGGMGGGSGGGIGSGIGPYVVGNGVKPPIAIFQPLPAYTEEARKARAEGIVLIQAVIRRDGTVDSFKVLRGLGYGLDESAINTIATMWRFKPGTLNGAPVDVQANIEVSFRLY
jgi:periplasmic protein TonB